MVLACDDCAIRRGLDLSCIISDGPEVCAYCGKKKAHALFSEPSSPIFMITLLLLFGLSVIFFLILRLK